MGRKKRSWDMAGGRIKSSEKHSKSDSRESALSGSRVSSPGEYIEAPFDMIRATTPPRAPG